MIVSELITGLLCINAYLFFCQASSYYVNPIFKHDQNIDWHKKKQYGMLDDCFDPTNYGYSYQGKTSITKPGIKCIYWSKQFKYGSSKYNYDHNYCRNPDRKIGGPWCYIGLTSWAYCDISICRKPGYFSSLISLQKRRISADNYKKIKNLQDEDRFYVTDLMTVYHPITTYYTNYETITATSITTSTSFVTLSSTLRSLITTTRTATEYRTIFSPKEVRQTATKTVTFTLKGYDPQDDFYTVTEYSTITSTPTVIRSTTVRSIATKRQTVTKTDFQTRSFTNVYSLTRFEPTTVTSIVYRTADDIYYDRY